jgi:hypothetical protein
MSTAALQNTTLPVCSDNEVVTVACAYPRCGRSFEKRATDKRKKFCCTKCRVYASRLPQQAKRERWDKERNLYRVMEFDGRIVGPMKNVGPLSSFEKRKGEGQ